jgi:hypothetical protein
MDFDCPAVSLAAGWQAMTSAPDVTEPLFFEYFVK